MSRGIVTVADAIKNALRTDLLLTAYRGLPAFRLEIGWAESLAERAGLLLLYFFAIIGVLALLRRENRNIGSFILVCIGGVISIIAFSASAFDLVSLIPERWLPVSQILLSIPVVVGLLFVGAVFKNKMRMLLPVVLVVIIAFSAIISPSSGIDLPVYTTTYRPAFTEAEIEGVGTITEIYDGTIFTDRYYDMVVNDLGANTWDMTPHFAFEELPLEDIPGLVLVRQYIADKGILRSDEIGTIKLERDPRETLSDKGFARVYDSGEQTRCFTFVDDAIEGILKAAEIPSAEGEAFNIGSTHEVTIVSVARMIIDIVGKSKELEPEFISSIETYGSYEDIARRIPNASKAKKILDWEAKTNLDIGLRKTVEFFKKQV